MQSAASDDVQALTAESEEWLVMQSLEGIRRRRTSNADTEKSEIETDRSVYESSGLLSRNESGSVADPGADPVTRAEKYITIGSQGDVGTCAKHADRDPTGHVYAEIEGSGAPPSAGGSEAADADESIRAKAQALITEFDMLIAESQFGFYAFYENVVRFTMLHYKFFEEAAAKEAAKAKEIQMLKQQLEKARIQIYEGGDEKKLKMDTQFGATYRNAKAAVERWEKMPDGPERDKRFNELETALGGLNTFILIKDPNKLSKIDEIFKSR